MSLFTSILDQMMLFFANFFNILSDFIMNQPELIYKKYINFKLKYLKILFLLRYHITYDLIINLGTNLNDNYKTITYKYYSFSTYSNILSNYKK